MPRRIPAALVLVALAVPGCGRPAADTPKVEPVSGAVFVSGNPAAGAVVTFHPVVPAGGNKYRPHAVVQPDGTFRLTTYTTDDGAAAGEYAVTLYWPEKDDPDAEARGVVAKDRLQSRYRTPDRPYRRVTVRDGANELESFRLP